MDTTVVPTIRAAVRRFPLLGRPRPACPALSDRVTEVAEIAAAAGAQGENAMAEAAHALNKAALIASDCGLPDLARKWCWKHINVYRRLNTLTALQASYLLEPVLNLARLQIRAHDGQPALHLLHAMHQAVTTGANLLIDGHTLPLTNLAGTREELGKLRQWTWLQYLSEGIRIHALSGRWDDAVTHANSLNGVGQHLMDGRQAAIIAQLLGGKAETAGTLLGDSTIIQPWEQQVRSCLAVMCAAPGAGHPRMSTMAELFLAHEPVPGYAVYRARWGLTVATLASTHDEPTAQHVLNQVATEVLEAHDGYAAREVFGHRTALQIKNPLNQGLSRIVTAAQLGAGTMSEIILRKLSREVQRAEGMLAGALDVEEQSIVG
ncbi:hypothetical protein [Micromonospora sp. WMMD1155]|uniref:hypothetical protein n=1 Tax=Micromonospora sp. WMMD1155 TaxID=3016094 RepID=UPI00249B2F35|nr:hypothetical protein [Micromonospora sp. WMMD1155]WFE53028.1 hypothetical protein O7617_23105 [Micromonospora sp. WMMD1155]